MPTIKRANRKGWMRPKKYQIHSITNKKLYNSKAWKVLRNEYLFMNPLCVECFKHDIIRDAYIVDHIIPINKGGDPLPSLEGLQGLCPSCDAKKRARDK